MLSSTRLRIKLTRRARYGANYATHAHAHSERVIIGIRREDPQRIWERRCPLTPEAVERLVQADGFEVLVQPCERRIFKSEEFIKAGAKLHRTLAPAHLLVGIKETPLNEIHTDPVPSANVPRTQFMFSHTHKGQEYNIPLLSRFLHSPESHSLLPTLIDWELLTDAQGKRKVGFGWYAGVAGALEGLISTAHLHLTLGIASPFLSTPRPHTAPLSRLIVSLREIGNAISVEGTPKSMGPFVITVTGSGQVAKGALSILRDTLPIVNIGVEELPKLVRNNSTPLNKIYLLHATQDTYLFHSTSGERATRQKYYENPADYESRFHEIIAPYTTLVINGVGWTSSSPRLMTTEQTMNALFKVKQLGDELQSLQRDEGNGHHAKRDVMKGRCQSFADISCDIGGGLEFLPRSSTLSDPFFSLNLSSNLPPVHIMAVDILPTALPREASTSFCDAIMPYIRRAARRYTSLGPKSSKDSEIENELQRATISSGGMLREQHKWLQSPVDLHRKQGRKDSVLATPASVNSGGKEFSSSISQKKRVLLLGSGMVVGPAVEELAKHPDLDLIIASNDQSRNSVLSQGRSNVQAIVLDVSRRDDVLDLVRRADIVISLLPAAMHTFVAEMCIETRRNLVTASYISPAMRSLHDRAVQSDVLLLNEIGLDPGIDHCSALDLLSSIRKEGKKVISFTSLCGGLPAPECAHVPLKYKFSWSPRGVLSAASRDAKFLVDGKVTTIDGGHLLNSYIPDLPVSDVLKLEGLPNHDSLSYSSIYNLHETNGLKTLFRGTIRYPGFARLMSCFKDLGLLDTHRTLRIPSYSELIHTSVEDITRSHIRDKESMLSALAKLVPEYDHEDLYEQILWLSNLDGSGLPPPSCAVPVIDLFTSLLASRLAYAPHERDLVIMHHEVVTSARDVQPASRDEVHSSSLEVYGTSKHSAMAVCVGLPVAIAALRILDGTYKEAGVHGPTDPVLYHRILEGMKEQGVTLQHTSRKYLPPIVTVEQCLRDNYA